MATDPRVLRTKRDYHNAMIELLKTVEGSKAFKSVSKIAGAYKPTTLKSDKHVHLLGDVAGVGNLKSAIWAAYDLAYKL